MTEVRANVILDPKVLEAVGIHDVKEIVYNPTYEELFEEETRPELEGFEKGVVTEMGAVAVDTGVFTGRSPKDKWVVKDETTKDTLWWTSEKSKNDNKPINKEVWSHLKDLVTRQLSGKRLFVIDGFCGTNPDARLCIRIITEVAWQAHFVKNMFIRPTVEELKTFKPDFVVMNGAKTTNPNWKEQGLNSENFTAFNLTERLQVIGGTWYGGEMKKGMFAMMNYFLPLKGIASMHCSANVGEKEDDVAIFFGLSGTGKTTLSADPKRALIGDDEHGWDDEGIFNFEGGCYAKTIDLTEENEPDIYRAIRRDALLENVSVTPNGKIDFFDGSKTENTRVSYPLNHIDNIVKPVSRAGHARKVIFLTADAFGVLPPVSVLTPEQTKYHFLSGFTAKLAGTERGITEPTPTFSSCFGAAFLTLHPTRYAEELVKKMEEHGATAYLVNTGWNGTGKRISIQATRAIIDAIMDGTIDKAETSVLPYFGLHVPQRVEGVDNSILNPQDTYADKSEWASRARDLASRFINNFDKFTDNEEGKALVAAGPKLDQQVKRSKDKVANPSIA